MSLTVSVYHKTETGSMGAPLKPRPWKTERPQDDPEWTALPNEEKMKRVLGPPGERGKNLAGGEIWRTKVYGSDAVQMLGLTLLPKLAKNDLWISGDDPNTLEQEAEAVLKQAEQVAHQTGYEPEYITLCLTNIKNAAMKAKEINGGVVIW